MAQSSDFPFFFNHLIIHQILAKSSDFQPNHQIASCDRLQSSDHQMVQPSDDSIFIWMLWISLDGKHNDEWKIWWLKHLMIEVCDDPRIQMLTIRRQLSDIICQLGQLSARTTVSSDICQLGHLSARTTVRPDNCKVSNCQNPMDNCQIKLSELWKNCQSCGKTVSSDSCPLKTVRPDSCPPGLFC